VTWATASGFHRSFFGVYGFKPTTGRLNNDDFPRDRLGYGQETILLQPGPIARTLADLALAMAIFAKTSMRATFDNLPPVPWTDLPVKAALEAGFRS
jgi:Asp-tRNA(Asn)/Glu-tRNA(Gln) amidotransferase A subunit family amidase